MIRCSPVSAVPLSGPTITGQQTRYALGDIVNLNCSSNSSDPLADIFWYINSEAVSHLSKLPHSFPALTITLIGVEAFTLAPMLSASTFDALLGAEGFKIACLCNRVCWGEWKWTWDLK